MWSYHLQLKIRFRFYIFYSYALLTKKYDVNSITEITSIKKERTNITIHSTVIIWIVLKYCTWIHVIASTCNADFKSLFTPLSRWLSFLDKNRTLQNCFVENVSIKHNVSWRLSKISKNQANWNFWCVTMLKFPVNHKVRILPLW